MQAVQSQQPPRFDERYCQTYDWIHLFLLGIFKHLLQIKIVEEGGRYHHVLGDRQDEDGVPPRGVCVAVRGRHHPSVASISQRRLQE